MHLKSATAILVFSIVTFSPALPVLDLSELSAAHADGNGNGNDKSNGNGNDKANGNGKGKAVTTDEAMTPSELGKMNGALNANINAVLAHIRNGQVTNGPVGLLAGLAVADSAAAAAAEAAATLQGQAEAFGALQTAVTAQGFGTVEDYLAAKAAGTATAEQIAALDPLVDAVGGVTEDGTTLAQTAPTAEEIAAAGDAAAAAAAQVAATEAAIIEAWNKDGDTAALIAALREKLSYNEAEIAAAIATAGEAAATE